MIIQKDKIDDIFKDFKFGTNSNDHKPMRIQDYIKKKIHRAKLQKMFYKFHMATKLLGITGITFLQAMLRRI